ncbi:alpha-2,8-sialyltransferase 8F isoform X1 [Oreochromis niloticus]|uniref:alpha-2,8-sialyltransferase 8F isoform X1 n=1 Tax=Oreochromis niloticus TaxID=8128 RepID=UPI000904AAC1|nr:alpha-2,8-sialyltransferase 8F isoform X1 [Oreochromis niloticus]
MRGQHVKSFFSFMITLLGLGTLITTLIWYKLDSNHEEPHRPPPQKKHAPTLSEICKACKEIIDKVHQRYNQTWKKNEKNYLRFRDNLRVKCNGFDNAIITQNNTPLGSNIVYSGEKKRTLQVKLDFFDLFSKENPFSNKKWDTCSVVGNGGILSESSCGKMIDSADLVIRCNLPPLENGYEKDVGIKTSLVTANPTIFFNKYGALAGRRLPFVESLRKYGNSLLLLPAFSFGMNTAVCQRAAYTIQDFKSPIQPVFFNPQYLDSLAQFWRSEGLKEARLSTGLIMMLTRPIMVFLKSSHIPLSSSLIIQLRLKSANCDDSLSALKFLENHKVCLCFLECLLSLTAFLSLTSLCHKMFEYECLNV